MKKILGFLTGFLAAFLILLTGGAKMQCSAADSYTVTFRAGNVGTFQTDAIASSGNVEVTENYIKIKVPEGASISEVIAAAYGTASSAADIDYFFRQVTSVESGYLLLDESTWGPAVSDVVERNEDYVLDYGTLVDPVEYEIQYVDSTSGESVATSLISYGNEGDVVKIEPITVSGYAAQGEGTSLTLSKSAKNQLSLKYVKTTSDNSDVITQEVPGNTTVNTQTRVIYETSDNAAVSANTNQTAGNNANAAGNDNNAADANAADNNNGAAENGDVTDIQDGDVPLSDGAQDADSADGKAITDGEVPLSDGKENDSDFAYGKILIPSAIVAGAAVAALSIFIGRKKRKANQIMSNTENKSDK